MELKDYLLIILNGAIDDFIALDLNLDVTGAYDLDDNITRLSSNLISKLSLLKDNVEFLKENVK